MSKAADPFQFVDRDLSPISSGIKDILGSDHPVLQLCASYFFDIDKGKKVRPAMVLGMAYALNAQETTGSDQEFYATASQKRLAEIVEMIHTASLFHDDVIDEADTRRGNILWTNNEFHYVTSMHSRHPISEPGVREQDSDIGRRLSPGQSVDIASPTAKRASR